jgi:hypothetical protein
MLEKQPKQSWGVHEDVIYSEMHSEMRRIRDYFFSFAQWSITVLLAVAGGFLALSAQGLSVSPLLRVLAIIIASLVAFGAISVVLYGDRRYEEMRRYLDERRPDWHDFKPMRKSPKPHHILQMIILVLWIAVIVVFLFFPVARYASSGIGDYL